MAHTLAKRECWGFNAKAQRRKEGKGQRWTQRRKKGRGIIRRKDAGDKLRGRVGKVKSRPFALTAGAAPVCLRRVCVGAGGLANADGRLCGGLLALR